MYQIFADDNLIYDPNIPDLTVTAAKVTLELNKTGSFTFTIQPSNPYINYLQKLKTIIRVYQDGYLLFKGRILNDTAGINQEKQVTCEGDLAFLVDSIQRPYDFQGTPAQFFTQLISNHNQQVETAKQFIVGSVTVTDPNEYISRSDTEYTDTLTLINDLIKTLGGYVFIRHEDDGNYIDYLADFETLNSQTIEFGLNMLDIDQTIKGEDIATAVIPLGARLETEDENGNTVTSDTRLTIADVNGGVDYIYSEEAVAKYGWIYKTVTYDDVTEAANLLSRGQDYLAEVINSTVSIEIDAVDLAGIKQDITNFRIGSYVKVYSKPHNIDQNMLVKKLTIDLFKPSRNKLSLGVSYSTFLDNQVSLNQGLGNIVDQVTNITNNFTTNVTQIENNVQSSINQSSDQIMSQVSEQYYRKDETDALISQMSTELTQTVESFEMSFTQFNQDLEDLAGNSTAKFNELSQYIRFEAGNIILGESGNEITLKIENDRITFLENNREIAYFTNSKLYITDAEVTTSLKLGNYAFLPRANGNLAFKKVGS